MKSRLDFIDFSYGSDPSLAARKIFINLATTPPPHSFHGCGGPQPCRKKEAGMNKIIQRIIKTAIESFPINERKKAEGLQNIIRKKRMRR